MNYPELPDKMNAPLYSGTEMHQYAKNALIAYRDNEVANTNVATLMADIKVRDSAMRTMQAELLRLRNKDITPDQLELRQLRLRVKDLEKRLSDLNWMIYPDRMGQ